MLYIIKLNITFILIRYFNIRNATIRYLIIFENLIKTLFWFMILDLWVFENSKYVIFLIYGFLKNVQVNEYQDNELWYQMI